MTSLSQIRKLQDIIDPRIKQRYTKYYNLPESVRQALLNVETANKIKEIADKNNLNDAQLWSISYITGVIMLGEANIVNFLKAIEVECEIFYGTNLSDCTPELAIGSEIPVVQKSDGIWKCLWWFNGNEECD